MHNKLVVLILLFTITIKVYAQERVLLSVSYYSQPEGTALCAPISIQMILKYWKKEMPLSVIRAKTYSNLLESGLIYKVKSFFKKNNFGFYKPVSSNILEQLKECLSKGIPVLTFQSLTPYDRIGHFRVYIGFDNIENILIAHDPLLGAYISISPEEFFQMGRIYNNWFLAPYIPGALLSSNINYSFTLPVEDLWKKYFYYACSLYEANFFIEAENFINKASFLYSKDKKNLDKIYLLKALIMLDIEEFSKAEEIYNKYLNNLNSYPILFLKAKLLFAKKQYSECEALCKKLLKISPSDERLLMLMSKTLSALGKSDTSDYYFKKATEINPILLDK